MVRDRPQIPQFSHLHTDYLDRLAAAGVRPEDVDIVVNTHIHYDHVGWNTRRDGDAWVPAFPNATYLVSRADHDYYDPVNAARMRPPRDEDERRRFAGMRLIFEDSIAPVAEETAARTDAMVFPAHFGGSGAVAVERGPEPDAFALARWADLDPAH